MSSILSPDVNYSLVSLPLYYGLCLVPHFYALNLATGGNPLAWDNRNSRSEELANNLKKKLDAKSYARYERSRSAHFNSLESFPLYATAILAANLARVGNKELNSFVLGISSLRVLYILSYIGISKQELVTDTEYCERKPSFAKTKHRYTPARTVLWISQLSWNLSFLWRVGKSLM